MNDVKEPSRETTILSSRLYKQYKYIFAAFLEHLIIWNLSKSQKHYLGVEESFDLWITWMLIIKRLVIGFFWQEYILSPLLWRQVVNKLLTKLERMKALIHTQITFWFLFHENFLKIFNYSCETFLLYWVIGMANVELDPTLTKLVNFTSITENFKDWSIIFE